MIVGQILVEHGLFGDDVAQSGVLKLNLPADVRLAYLRYLISSASLSPELAKAVVGTNESRLAPLAAAELAELQVHELEGAGIWPRAAGS